MVRSYSGFITFFVLMLGVCQAYAACSICQPVGGGSSFQVNTNYCPSYTQKIGSCGSPSGGQVPSSASSSSSSLSYPSSQNKFETTDEKLRAASVYDARFAGVHTSEDGVTVISLKGVNVISVGDEQEGKENLVSEMLLQELAKVYGESAFYVTLDSMLSGGAVSDKNIGDRHFYIRWVPKSFAQNYDYMRDHATELFALPGVISLDINEKTNNLEVGIDSFDHVTFSGLLNLMFAPGVREPFTINIRSGINSTSTLRERVDPIRGGVQIFRKVDSENASVCSIGLVAKIGGVEGILTAAHCTREFGVLEDGSIIHQGDPFGDSVEIGEASIETHVLSSEEFMSCPEGFECHASDSVFIPFPENVSRHNSIVKSERLNDFDNVNLKSTGRTTWVKLFRPGNFEGFDDLFDLTGLAGDTVYKTGRTTGTTKGKIVETCVNIKTQEYPDKIILCVNGVEGTSGDFSRPGDSGAAILIGLKEDFFDYTYKHGRYAYIQGILTAVDSTTTYYSTFNNIEYDLGRIQSLTEWSY